MIQLNRTRLTRAPAGGDAASPRWLLLIHAIPPRPAYLRVKIGRRLQKLGAIAVKNSVYALPLSEETREDFEWVVQEITADGGEASLCESRFVGGQTDEAIEQQFRLARQHDFLELAKTARRLVDSLSREPSRRARSEAAVARLRKRFEEIVGIDHFASPGRAEVDSLLQTAEQKLRPPKTSSAGAAPDIPALRDLRGRTWVTRVGIHVDRIASAWLIRRFIDPAAKLKYVEARGYAPSAGELRFDMFDAEFTHEGELCTFEVLLAKWGSGDVALRRIGEIVHDIDVRDEKFRRQETDGFAALIAGVCLEHREDGARLEAGSVVLDALYRAFQQRGRR